MKKRDCLLLLLLVACSVQVPEPVEAPVIPEQPAIKVPAPVVEPSVEEIADLYGNLFAFIINERIKPFSLVSSDAIFDSFGFIPVERYDARYVSDDVAVLVSVFKFVSRAQLDVVLNSDFYQIVQNGAYNHEGHLIALFLSHEDHRVAFWPSGTSLVYVDTFIPDFAAREIVDAYISKYPSDLETVRCFDDDSDDHYIRGETNRVRIGNDVVEWTDVCLVDYPPYRNGQFVPKKMLRERDGLLEGLCDRDPYKPGYIDEYFCRDGCKDGKCI